MLIVHKASYLSSDIKGGQPSPWDSGNREESVACMRSVDDESGSAEFVKPTTSTQAKSYMVKKMDDVVFSLNQGLLTYIK